MVLPCDALGGTSTVLPSNKGDSGEPRIVEFGCGLVEMRGARKIPHGENGIDIRVVVPAVWSPEGEFQPAAGAEL